jgi:hypothetical protein
MPFSIAGTAGRQSVEVTGAIGTYDLSLLSDEELDILERIVTRATPSLSPPLPAPILSGFEEATD